MVPRRERDPRPSIEVIGGAPTEESVREVAVGDDPRAGRWWKVLIAGLVVVIALVAAVGGDDDGESEAASSSTTRSTVRRSTTTTASTIPAPIGPMLEVQTGAFLLLAGQTGDWELIDLDTGTSAAVEREGGDVYGGLVAVRGGIVVADGSTSRYLPLLTGGEPVDLGGGGFLLSSGRDDRVWVGDSSDGRGPVDLRLVDLRGRTLARSEMPPTAFYGATAQGPVISDGGRAYVLTEDGPRFLAVGLPIGTSADRVAVRECNEGGRCSVALVDVATGASQVLTAMGSTVGSLSGMGGGIQLTPDGDIVAVEYDVEGNPEIHWLDPEGRLLGTGVIEIAPSSYGFGGDLAFLPGREGIVWPSGNDELQRIRPDAGQLEVDLIPLPSSRRFERAVVIRP
jgi:hypothetical protein